jgi:CARDB
MSGTSRPTPRPAARLAARTALLSCLLWALLLSGAHAQPTSSGQTPSVTATLTQCQAAVEQTNRSATFSGQMVAIPSTQRMAMRVDVQERLTGETSFRPITAPGLGVWRGSDPGVKIYRYLRQVTGLPAPGDFRAVVSFRWMGSKGHLIRETARHTQACEQPDERPKLVVAQVRASPNDASTSADYEITIRNEGRGPAGVFGVALSVGGVPQPTLIAPPLAGSSSTLLNAAAPICTPGDTIEVTLDPKEQIEEAQGGGLAQQIGCPLPTGGGGE